MERNLPSVVVVVVLVAACASAEKSATESAKAGQGLGAPRIVKSCHKDRVATVSIEDNEFVTVSPEPIRVCSGGLKVTWIISSTDSGWIFPDDEGIKFKNSTQYENCKRHKDIDGNFTIFRCQNKNQNVPGTYPYAITVESSQHGRKTRDPNVINE